MLPLTQVSWSLTEPQGTVPSRWAHAPEVVAGARWLLSDRRCRGSCDTRPQCIQVALQWKNGGSGRYGGNVEEHQVVPPSVPLVPAVCSECCFATGNSDMNPLSQHVAEEMNSRPSVVLKLLSAVPEIVGLMTPS